MLITNSILVIETHSYVWALRVLQKISGVEGVKFIKLETPGSSIVSVFMEGELASIKQMHDEISGLFIKADQFISSIIIPKPHVDLVKYLKEK